MDSVAVRSIFALLFVTVVMTEALNHGGETVARKRRSPYFGQPFAMPRKRIPNGAGTGPAFLGMPRMGRGYLALPRMGRSQAATRNDVAVDANGVSCCTTGLKKEWVQGEDGLTREESVCEADSCCPDYSEEQKTKADGTFYTMCVPNFPTLADRNQDAASDNVIFKLKRLLRN